MTKLFTLLALTAALASCDRLTSESVTLRFPPDQSLGELRIVEDVNCFTCGTGSTDLGPAQGAKSVRLPHGWYISLTMPRAASQLLPLLDDPSLARIGDLKLAGSDVTDEDLEHISHLTLRSLDLSRTAIEGRGLRFVRADPHWLFLTLVDCASLNLDRLAPFSTNKRLTIRVTSASYGTTLTGRDKAVMDRARQVVCEGRDEQACGIQLR